MDTVAYAHVGKYAENHYWDKASGLLDQMACAVGGLITIDFMEPSDPKVEKIDFDFGSQNHSLIIVQTGRGHADLSADYSAVPSEMKKVAEFFGKNYCSEITEKDVIDNLAEVRKYAGDRSVLRALHFFEENKRVENMVKALKEDRFDVFLENITASGNSSWKWLQNCYTNSNYQEQGITVALALTELFIADKGRGACRVHGGGFDTFHEARKARFERFEELRRRWDEEHAKLKKLVVTLRQAAAVSHEMASRYAAAQTRLKKFEDAGPPEAPPREQNITMRLKGGRTGVRAFTMERLELTGLMQPFDLEVFYGERVAVLGANGAGKSHLLRLLAGDTTVEHTGDWKLGARVVPGHFRQTHAHPELFGRTVRSIIEEEHALSRGAAMGALRRYELDRQEEQKFESLSGGQQARLMILKLELDGVTALLLDEPTDNLDLESAEALQAGLEAFDGTVLCVTHDRWFARTFDRFLVFGADGRVFESPEPVWDVTRVERER